MIKKSKLNKCNIPKLNQMAQTQTIPQNISNCVGVMREKNEKFIQSKQQLKQQIESIRNSLQRIIYQMNDSTKDRIQLKVKKAMDKNSRPQTSDIKQLTDMFTYMEKQSKLTNRNTKQNQLITNQLQLHNNQIKQKSLFVGNYSDLDEQFYQLNEECTRQLKVRDDIIKQRDQKRRFYQSIESNIQQCRVQYELVEEKIRDAQIQLIHLTGYLQNRKQQELDHIKQLKMQASSIEDKILKAQSILNMNELQKQKLLMMEIESLQRIQQ